MTFARLIFSTAVLMVSTAALAQQPQDTADPSSTTCSFSYSSGPITTFTRYCLGANGNIVQFDSPSGFEYISNGGPLEGYGICDVNPNIAYYDYASADSGNWGPTTVTTPNATTQVFLRTTADGIWQLKQTIVQLKATAATTGSVKITMALKNLSTISRNVTLLRIANVNNGPVATNDEFVSSYNSAFGQEPGASWGMGLTTNTFTFAHNGLVISPPVPPNPCHYVTNVQNFAIIGDGAIGHVYAITVPKGATKTVAMTYKPI
ncbi:MAG TPA: hypothetical protein VMS18_08145 [Candidatus Binatia bacterium]|nr:hypothetical protein [Candidatus Binatia bacterium]